MGVGSGIQFLSLPKKMNTVQYQYGHFHQKRIETTVARTPYIRFVTQYPATIPLLHHGVSR